MTFRFKALILTRKICEINKINIDRIEKFFSSIKISHLIFTLFLYPTLSLQK